MLDDNGFVDNGTIIFNDDELSDTRVAYGPKQRRTVAAIQSKLDEYARLEPGAEIFRRIQRLEDELHSERGLSQAEEETMKAQLGELNYQRTELFNLKQTIDPSKERDRAREVKAQLADLDRQIKALEAQRKATIKAHRQAAKDDTAHIQARNKELAELKARYAKLTAGEIPDETKKRNEILAKEIYLSVGRFDYRRRTRSVKELLKALRKAMEIGVDLSDDSQRNAIFDEVAFRVKYLDETEDSYCVWRTFYAPGRKICTYQVDLFQRNGDGTWDRAFEEHRERAWEREELEADLAEAGFGPVTVTGDLTGRPPAPEEDRWNFRCQKPVNSK